MVWAGGVFLGMIGGMARAQTAPVAVRAVVSAACWVQGLFLARIAVEIVSAEALSHLRSSRPHDEYLIPTKAKLEASPGIAAGPTQYPAGPDIAGPLEMGKPTVVSAYQGTVYILLPITVAADVAVGPRTLTVSLETQACNEESCLPPETHKLKVDVEIAAAGTAALARESELFLAAGPPGCTLSPRRQQHRRQFRRRRPPQPWPPPVGGLRD